MEYEKLLEEAEKNNIYVIENASFESKSEGLINGDVIGLNKNIRSYKKKACVLAEELGHYHTTTGDIISQSSDSDRKQELRARIWAYEKLIGLFGIVRAYKKGCQAPHEMAEYLDVTEEFLIEALSYYKGRYGNGARFSSYIITFEPTIGVFEQL